MITHEPHELSRIRKYGTPSENFVRIAESPVRINGRLISFPVSLNSRRGQKLLYDILQSVDLFLKDIPCKSYDLFNFAKETLTHRRKDTLANLLMVLEAICHRAASEFKLEILFAFDSINTWIKAKYDKELGYQTLHKALELLIEAKFIKVNEWGKRGNRSRATKIEVLPRQRGLILTYTSNLDDWLLYSDHAMSAVYRRESTTRQDVVEAAIHHFAENFVNHDEAALYVEGKINDGTVARLFGSTDARMVESVTEDGVWTDDYLDRLLGGLVPTLQEDDAYSGNLVAGVRGSP